MNTTAQPTLIQLAQAAAMHVRAGRQEKAIAIYRDILAKDPLHREALFNLAMLLKQQPENSEWEVYERKFHDLKPSASTVSIRKGRFFHAQGDFAEALAHFRAAKESGGDNLELSLHTADSLLDQGDPAEALSYYERALKFDPRSAGIRTLMAVCCLSLKRFHRSQCQLHTVCCGLHSVAPR
jgi:tetratricopeptide (TPR) repeat protein